jgi:hypothetical protein
METATHGLLSSVVATSICYPLDTIKTRLQANNMARYKHPYRGVLPELLGAAPSSMLYWYSYGKMRDAGYSPFYASMVGAVAGNFVDTPFDIYKKQRQLKLQTGLQLRLFGSFGLLNVLHSVGYNSIYMPLLQYCMKDKGLSKTMSIFICCSVANIATYPLDRCRTKVIYKGELAPWYKGLGYRLVYGNLYSGLYMHIFLMLSDGKI